MSSKTIYCVWFFPDFNTSKALTSDKEAFSFTQDHLESDFITPLSVDSPVMESTKGIRWYSYFVDIN
jgi:hypothetical protein